MAGIDYEEELRNLEKEQPVDYEEELRQLSFESTRTATTQDLIRMRRGEQTPETKTEQPVNYEEELRQLNETPVAAEQKMLPTTGVMPYESTSEFAGMEMEEEKRAPTYTFDDLWQRDDLFSIIQDYAKARGGKEFKGDITDVKAARVATTADLIAKRKGEVPAQTRKEFVADWMQSMRAKELNVLLMLCLSLTTFVMPLQSRQPQLRLLIRYIKKQQVLLKKVVKQVSVLMLMLSKPLLPILLTILDLFLVKGLALL